MRDDRVVSSPSGFSAEEIVELVRARQTVSAEELLDLLGDQFPAGLADAHRLARIHSLLRHLVDVGRIRNQGSRRYPRWGLL